MMLIGTIKWEESFAQRLKELRAKAGLTQSQFAKEIGEAHRETIKSWETGYRKPNVTALIKCSLYFDVSTDYLLGLSPFKTGDFEKAKTFSSVLDNIIESSEKTALSVNYLRGLL